jgi:hypothetical protein
MTLNEGLALISNELQYDAKIYIIYQDFGSCYTQLRSTTNA